MPDHPPDPSPHWECLHIVARGRVQGVGFRFSLEQRADIEGIAGWVRNRADGSVEAQLQGPPSILRRVCEWLRHDVPGASVSDLEVARVPEPWHRMTAFERRPTV